MLLRGSVIGAGMMLLVASAVAQPAPDRVPNPPAAPPAAAPAAQDEAALVAKGRLIVDKNCARCHATGAAGASPHEKAPPFRVVAERYPAEHLAEALAEGIVSGHPDMPVYVMAPDEIEAFLAYLDSFAAPPR